MPDIGHVTTHFLPVTGGQEVYVRNLIAGLPGYRHTVFQLRHSAAADETSPSAAVVRMARHRRLPVFLDMNMGLTLRRRQLRRMDLLVVNYPEYFRPVAWHPRAVVLSHGATWGNLSGRLREAKRAMSRYALGRCAAYVFNDTFAMREIGIDVRPGTRYFERVTDKAVFIPNCVDTEYFHPTAGIPSIRQLHPICVPRNLNHGRGVDLALQALAILAAKGHDCTMVVVGDSNIADQAYRESLFRVVSDRGLVGRVLFLGSVPNASMRDVYSSSLVTLIPTRYREGTSLAALESMACGTPVVATGVEGLLDLPAMHCEPTAESMAEALGEALANREKLGEQQAGDVRRRFSSGLWAQAWRGVVARLLGSGRVGRD